MHLSKEWLLQPKTASETLSRNFYICYQPLGWYYVNWTIYLLKTTSWTLWALSNVSRGKLCNRFHFTDIQHNNRLRPLVCLFKLEIHSVCVLAAVVVVSYAEFVFVMQRFHYLCRYVVSSQSSHRVVWDSRFSAIIDVQLFNINTFIYHIIWNAHNDFAAISPLWSRLVALFYSYWE